MPSVKPKVKVIKVPRETKLPDYPQTFPRMPILYLELLENPEKVKPELLNKPYKPILSTTPLATSPVIDSRKSEVVEEYTNTSPPKDVNIAPKPNIPEATGDNSPPGSIKDPESPTPKDNLEDRLDKLLRPVEAEPEAEISKEPFEAPQEEDELSSRLTKLLSEDTPTSEPIPISPDKYSRSRYDPVSMRSVNVPPPPIPVAAEESVPSRPSMPPTLDELQAQGGYKKKPELRDVARHHNVASEQEEEDIKREYLYKIRILKKAYPDGNFTSVENFTVYTDLELMKREYEDMVRSLSLDSTVENYKTWLMYGFVGCEFVLGKWLKIDMEGFAAQQMVSMKKYDRLLLELGEKNYSKGPSRIPVEIRLIGMVLMQAGFFIVMKMITAKGGANLFGLMSGLTGSPNKPTEARRRMKPPAVSVDDLPDV